MKHNNTTPGSSGKPATPGICYVLLGFALSLLFAMCPPVNHTCTDGIQNGRETGIDCGDTCGPCPPAVCNDGIRNGNETGIDCGGNCGPCMSMGFADLHAHPATHYGFGAASNGKGGIIWGTVQGSLEEALPPCPMASHCGCDDAICQNSRQRIMAAMDPLIPYPHGQGGNPAFAGWPNARSVTHQQMHISWMRRAWQGGLRLMVASVMDNQVLSMLWHRTHGKGSPGVDPLFDFNAATVQLAAIRTMVESNSDWMAIVTTPNEAITAMSENKLAVVLGLEMDMLTLDQILQLRDQFGVRVVTPIHLVNNSFGGAAVYDPTFNTANHFLTHGFFDVVEDPDIAFRFATTQKFLRWVSANPLDGGDLLRFGAVEPTDISTLQYSPILPGATGHKNALGLRSPVAIRRLMAAGMLIDLAHMSEKSTEEVLGIAEQYGYPVMNSHTGIRAKHGKAKSERDMKRDHAQRLMKLGGIIGMGTGTEENEDPIDDWQENLWNQIELYGNGGLALGTDFNGFSLQMATPEIDITYPFTHHTIPSGEWNLTIPSMTALKDGNRTYDFKSDGLAQYGMLPELIYALGIKDRLLYQKMFWGATATVRMWQKVEQARANVPQ